MPGPSFQQVETMPVDAGSLLAFLSDVKRAADWMPEIIRVEPLDELPVRPGWRYRETRRMGRREFAATITITEVSAPGDPTPYHLTHVSNGMGNDARYRFTIEPDGPDRSRLTLDATVTPTAWYGRLFSRFLLAAIRKSDGDLLARLAEHLSS